MSRCVVPRSSPFFGSIANLMEEDSWVLRKKALSGSKYHSLFRHSRGGGNPEQGHGVAHPSGDSSRHGPTGIPVALGTKEPDVPT